MTDDKLIRQPPPLTMARRIRFTACRVSCRHRQVLVTIGNLSSVICHLSFSKAARIKPIQILQTGDAIFLNGGSVRQVDFHPGRAVGFPFDLIDSLSL